MIEIALALWPQRCHLISMKLEIAARQLESLGSPVRLKIYRALVRAGEDGLACGVLQEKVGLAASTLSHHIRHLREAGLVFQERQATTLICRASYPAMSRLIGYLVDECCADAACQSDRKVA
jgi:DNA-binding transcriptional ArsR family regulator